jgi:hypothetical protein
MHAVIRGSLLILFLIPVGVNAQVSERSQVASAMGTTAARTLVPLTSSELSVSAATARPTSGLALPPHDDAVGVRLRSTIGGGGAHRSGSADASDDCAFLCVDDGRVPGIEASTLDVGLGAHRVTEWSGNHSLTPASSRAGPPIERVVLGTTIGAIAGAGVGLGIVAMTRKQTSADENMLPGAQYVAGAVIGSIPGMLLGAHIANGQRGNPLLTGVAAVGGTALGLLAGGVVGNRLAQGDTGKAPEVVGVSLAVAIPVVLTSLVERRTSPR